MHVVAVEGDAIAQQLHFVLDLIRGQALTQPALQPAERHVDLRLLQVLGVLVHQAGDLYLRVQLGEQLHGQVEGLVAALRVDALFIAGGRLGAVVVPQGRAADAGGLEIGDLQDDLVGGGKNGVLGAAHDACKAHHPRLIGDDQIVGGQGQLLAVE